MQNTQNEVKQQMTEEELQRTQVLNFDDFKKTARYEKLSSKKPAIIVALIGIFAIMIGGGIPIVQSGLAKSKEKKESSTFQARKKEDNKKSEITCSKSALAGATMTGLNETMIITYKFEDEKLVSISKKLELSIPDGLATGPDILQGFQTALQPYLIQQNGYDLSVVKTEKGLITTTNVDYNTVDINSIPALNQGNGYFNVTYVKDSPKDSVIQDMTAQEYTCK